MNKTRYITTAGIIAALYVIFSFISGAVGLSSGAIQLRLSESLCVLSALTPAAVLGVTLGCFLYNLLSGCLLIDTLLGSFASLIGCLGVMWLGRLLKITSSQSHKKRATAFLLSLPYVLSNALIIPYILTFYGAEKAYLLNVCTVFVGEFISCVILGTLLYFALYPSHKKLFMNNRM